MKKFIAGLVIGLLLATAGISFASNETIRIFVNNQEVVPDVPPVIIDGRVMVPARFIAEPLGAAVEWDGENRIVTIKSDDFEKIILNKEEWLHLRDVALKYNWVVQGDGFVYQNGTKLFNWKETCQIVDGAILVPVNLISQFTSS